MSVRPVAGRWLGAMPQSSRRHGSGGEPAGNGRQASCQLQPQLAWRGCQKAACCQQPLLAVTECPRGRCKLTLAGTAIAPRVDFLAPPRTDADGQEPSLADGRFNVAKAKRSKPSGAIRRTQFPGGSRPVFLTSSRRPLDRRPGLPGATGRAGSNARRLARQQGTSSHRSGRARTRLQFAQRFRDGHVSAQAGCPRRKACEHAARERADLRLVATRFHWTDREHRAAVEARHRLRTGHRPTLVEGLRQRCAHCALAHPQQACH